MKRNILLIPLSVLILSLSACGGKDKPDETKPTLEVIKPTETEPQETLSDKLDETKTLTIEPAPEPRGIGVDENGNKIVESSPFVEESSTDINNSEASTEISDTNTSDSKAPEEESKTAEEKSKTAEEESKMAEENNAKLKEIQESATESLAAEEETLSADDYQQIDNAIDEYNKKQVQELLEGVDTSKL